MDEEKVFGEVLDRKKAYLDYAQCTILCTIHNAQYSWLCTIHIVLNKLCSPLF